MLGKIIRLPQIVTLGVLLVIASIFFSLTDPLEMPPAALMLAFGLIFAITYCILRLLLGSTRLLDRFSGLQRGAIYIGGAALPVLLLAFQSLGQLTIRDLITVSVLYGTGYFYVSHVGHSPAGDEKL